MRTFGKFLIFGAVLMRIVVVLSDTPEFPLLFGLLAAYGLLLFIGTWAIHRQRPGWMLSPRIQLAYLFLQANLVLGMLLLSNLEDFLAELFIPPSLDAVSFFGKRSGFRVITLFSLAMTGILLFSSEGPLFGLAMGVLYSGLCFVFGGYAVQVQKAEEARSQNQRTFEELQEAHRQLQGYADRLAYLAVERERNHLARDLHDSVTQTVFSMNLAAQSANLLWEKEPTRLVDQLSRLEELAASAQREIQSLVSQLSPQSIKEIGLPAALHKLALEQKSRYGLQVLLDIQWGENVSDSIATALYSIAQEALTNTAKHSGVCEAVLRLHLEKDKACLEVEDHGRGFDTQALPTQRGHLGLAGMSERAREMGWELSVESQRGQGTHIHVSGSLTGGPK